MKITILTYGSQGDVNPFIALSKGLILAGHQVRLVAPECFRFLADEPKIDFRGLPGDPTNFVKELTDRAGNNWWRMIQTVTNYVVPLGLEVSEIARRSCQDSDLLIHSFLMTNTGFEIARELDIPDISVQLFPVFSPTADFPAPAFQDLGLGSIYNKLTHHLVTQIFWQGSRMIYRWVFRKHPETPPLTAWPFNPQNQWCTPILYAFSPNVVPRPNEWPERVQISGYWFPGDAPDWSPPPDLVEFLDQGPPPVTIAFGSTSTKRLEKIYRVVMESLETNNQRGVFVGSDQQILKSSSKVIQFDYLPYGWIFPRSAVVIHHGGAGTTGIALKAGVPNIVLPFTSDQPFWGQRVYKLGAGPKPINIRRLSVKKLTQALNQSIQNQNMKDQVKSISGQIQQENGVKKAIKFIEDYYQNYLSSHNPDVGNHHNGSKIS